MKASTWILIFIFFFQISTAISAEKKYSRSDSKSLKKSYKELIQQGHRFYDEGALPEALSRYEQASQLKSKIPPNLRYRMASLYYLLDDDEKVIDLLQHRLTLSKIHETYYLLGLSYKDLRHLDLAKSSFQKYLEKENVQKRKEALYELAEIAFEKGQLDDAAAILFHLAEEHPTNQVLMALAKILIRQGNLERAERILRENVFQETELDDYAYLMGEIAINKGQYGNAIDYFREAKTHQKKPLSHWNSELLKSEIQAYLIFLDNFKIDPKERLSHWLLMQKPLKDLVNAIPTCELDLAHYYLVTYNLFGDPVSIAQANALLDHYLSYETNNKPRALFLQAELALTYKEKDRLYRLLTAEDIKNPYVLKGWYLRGMNDLQYGQKHQASDVLNRACYEFEIVWKHCLPFNKYLAGMALKSHIQAYLAQNTQKARENALKLIDSILTEDTNFFPNQDEILYLQGLAAMDIKPNLAIDSFQQSIDLNQTKASKEALFALAAFYYKKSQWELAKEKFLDLVSKDKDNQKTPEALHFAVECAAKQGKEASDLKRELFENYPDSPFAAEAYLNYFPRQQYIKGDSVAIEHLLDMPNQFLKSPWCIEAYFILGLDLKREHYTSSGKLLRSEDLSKALAAFQNAESAYNSLDEMGFILVEEKQYFYTLRCHAIIERALTNIQIAENCKGTKKRIYLEYANDLLRKVIQDFYQNSLLTTSDPYPSLLEECEYNLAMSHIKMGEDREAEEILSEMLKKYHKSKITRGFYLSQVHYDLAMIAKKRGQTTSALEKLGQAEDAAKGKILTSDQMLDIWIEQSLCYLDQGDDEMAMRILSNVINQDVASAERLKAMYLRSNIYQKQGREELALRQLEALSKQQGEWAAKAKEKLQNYD